MRFLFFVIFVIVGWEGGSGRLGFGEEVYPYFANMFTWRTRRTCGRGAGHLVTASLTARQVIWSVPTWDDSRPRSLILSNITGKWDRNSVYVI